MSANATTVVRRHRKWWKESWVADHYAKLKAPEILREFMKHKGFSITELARRATLERTENGGPKVSRQMISYLVNGDLHSCKPDLAACIELVLDVPAHAIFDVLPKSSTDGQNDNQQVTAA